MMMSDDEESQSSEELQNHTVAARVLTRGRRAGGMEDLIGLGPRALAQCKRDVSEAAKRDGWTERQGPSAEQRPKSNTHMPRVSTALFTDSSVGKTIEVEGGRVLVNGVFRFVRWKKGKRPVDGRATIAIVDPDLSGEVYLNNGTKFENPATVTGYKGWTQRRQVRPTRGPAFFSRHDF